MTPMTTQIAFKTVITVWNFNKTDGTANKVTHIPTSNNTAIVTHSPIVFDIQCNNHWIIMSGDGDDELL